MAKGLWAWYNDAYQKAVSLWFVPGDSNGVYKEAKAAWVRVNNTWKKFWPIAGSVKATAQAVANTQAQPYWSAIKINWTAKYASKASLVDLSTGSTLTTKTYIGSNQDYVEDTYTHTVIPESNKTYRVDITDLDGVIVSSAASATTPKVDTPVGFTAKQVGNYGDVQAGKYKYTLTWTATTGATGYRIKYKIGGVSQTDISQTATTTDIFLQPGVAYSFSVSAYWTSAGTNYYSSETTQSGTTTAIATATYYYTPRANATWQAGTGGSGTSAAQWRSDYLVHGKATTAQNVTAAGRGVQTAMFFNYKNKTGDTTPVADLQTLVNAISSASIYILRDADAKINPNGTACSFVTHNHASKPTGAPKFVQSGITAIADPKVVAAGKGEWIPLDKELAKKLVSGTILGFGWGNVSKNYMLGPVPSTNLAKTYPSGTIKITIGS